MSSKDRMLPDEGGSLRRADGSRCQMCAVYWTLLAKGHLRRKNFHKYNPRHLFMP